MKKRFRLKRNEEFQKIIARRRSVVGKSFILYYGPSFSAVNGRVGISTSKKLGNAVVRNKIRRQVRMMAMELTRFEIRLDIIIIVRNRYLENTFEDNKKELLTLYETVYNKIDDELIKEN